MKPAAATLVLVCGASALRPPRALEASLSRRDALLAGALGPALLSARPTAAAAADARAEDTLVADDGSFSLRFPADAFERYGKPVKTHQLEANIKSRARKGFVIGVAVDPVKLESLEAFGDPDFVGQRVIGVERKKDGTLDARLDSTRATSDAKGKTYYELQ